jgi:hypothetical protein
MALFTLDVILNRYVALPAILNFPFVAAIFTRVFFFIPEIYRRGFRKYLFIPGLIVLGVIFCFLNSALAMTIMFISVAAVLTAIYFCLPGIFRKGIIKYSDERNRKMLTDGKQQHKLTLNDNNLTLTTPKKVSTFHWNWVTDINVFEQYLYIELGTDVVIIIPQRAFSNETDFQQFAGGV